MKTLTLTLNDHTYDELIRNVNSGQVSSFVDELIQTYFHKKTSNHEDTHQHETEDYGSVYAFMQSLPKASPAYQKDKMDIQNAMRAEWND